MKTGNKAQAIVLSVAAVGAIGFLASRLIPAKNSAQSASIETDTASNQKLASVDGLPTEILRDAFSHPAFLKRAIAADPKKEIQTESPDVKPLQLKWPFDDQLPKPEGKFATTLERSSSTEVESKPSGNTEKNQQVDKKLKSKFELKAIMRATKPLALISMDGTTELLVKPGDQLTGTYKVGKFSENAVQLVSARDSFWLYVGQEVEK